MSGILKSQAIADIPQASPTVFGKAKLYSNLTESNTDGSVNQSTLKSADEANVKLTGTQAILGAKVFEDVIYSKPKDIVWADIVDNLLPLGYKEYIIDGASPVDFEIRGIRKEDIAASQTIKGVKYITFLVSNPTLKIVHLSADVELEERFYCPNEEDIVGVGGIFSFTKDVRLLDGVWVVRRIDEGEFLGTSHNNNVSADFKLSFNNGAKVYQGVDKGRGGAGGLVVECTVGYTWIFENGYHMLTATGNGLVYHVIAVNAQLPTQFFDIDMGFAIGCKFYSVINDITYVCIDNTSTEAVWEVYQPIISIVKADLNNLMGLDLLDISKKYRVTDALSQNNRTLLLTPSSTSTFYELCDNLTDGKTGKYNIVYDWFIPSDNIYLLADSIYPAAPTTEGVNEGYIAGDIWINPITQLEYVLDGNGAWNVQSGNVTLTNIGDIELANIVARFQWKGDVCTFSINGNLTITDPNTSIASTIRLEFPFDYMGNFNSSYDAIFTIQAYTSFVNHNRIRFLTSSLGFTKSIKIEVDRASNVVEETVPVSIVGQFIKNPLV